MITKLGAAPHVTQKSGSVGLGSHVHYFCDGERVWVYQSPHGTPRLKRKLG